MTSFWPMLCRIVDGIEGIIGIVINISIICILWRRSLQSNLATYRISITISAFQGSIYAAVMALFGGVVHMCRADRFICVLYGPVTYLPPAFGDALAASSIILAFSVWAVIPPACILQYMALCRPHFSIVKRMAIAYVPSVILILWSIKYCSAFWAGPLLHQKLLEDVKEIHNLQEDDSFLVCGTTLFKTDENSVSMASLLFEGVMPTYAIAYLLFAGCCLAVRRQLAHFGVRLSDKTAVMQRRFLRTLVLQGLLPLAVITVPLTILLVGLLSGLDIASFTVFLSFSFYLVPIAQASVSLSFVKRGLKSTTPLAHSVGSTAIRVSHG